MSELISRNKALMRRIYDDMWNTGNPAFAAEIFARPEGVQRFVSQFLLSFPDLHHTVEEIIAEGDLVAVKFSAHGTHSGQWLTFAPTGRPIHYTGITWARIAENKIIEHRTWWDKTDLIQQIAG